MSTNTTDIKPVYGHPEFTPPTSCDEHCDPGCVHHVASAGWDLSFGSRLNVGRVDTSDGRLVVSLHLSDDALANGMVYREVTPQQIADFARHLLAVVGAEQVAR